MHQPPVGGVQEFRQVRRPSPRSDAQRPSRRNNAPTQRHCIGDEKQHPTNQKYTISRPNQPTPHYHNPSTSRNTPTKSIWCTFHFIFIFLYLFFTGYLVHLFLVLSHFGFLFCFIFLVAVRRSVFSFGNIWAFQLWSTCLGKLGKVVVPFIICLTYFYPLYKLT